MGKIIVTLSVFFLSLQTTGAQVITCRNPSGAQLSYSIGDLSHQPHLSVVTPTASWEFWGNREIEVTQTARDVSTLYAHKDSGENVSFDFKHMSPQWSTYLQISDLSQNDSYKLECTVQAADSFNSESWIHTNPQDNL